LNKNNPLVMTVTRECVVQPTDSFEIP